MTLTVMQAIPNPNHNSNSDTHVSDDMGANLCHQFICCQLSPVTHETWQLLSLTSPAVFRMTAQIVQLHTLY